MYDRFPRNSVRLRRVAGSDWLLAISRLGAAHWLFGNLYEEVVRIPERLSADERLLGAGSPVRYYIPAAPITLVATVLTAVCDSGGSNRVALRVGLAGTVFGGALTAYVVRTVIARLMGRGGLEEAERARLIRRWHRVNRIRIVLAGSVVFTLWLADHSE